MKSLPSKEQIRQWVTEHPGLSSKRDIAKAFGIKADQKIELKRLLREMEAEGDLSKRARRFIQRGELPPIALLKILPPDAAGDLFAEPMEEGVSPDGHRILFVAKKGDPALAAGDRILARLARVDLDDYTHEARLIRRIGGNAAKVLGIFRKNSEGGRILPIDKGQDKEWRVRLGDEMEARDGELVEAEAISNRRMGLPQARVTNRLGDPGGPKAVSLIAIHQHGIPDQFPDKAMSEAENAPPFSRAGREDLRDLMLVTIDPKDARDRDDAVLVEYDREAGNPNGFVLWVAIADVANYVRPGSALDREARRRGNSSYFPDRVVPMLPDVLSGDLCSLHEHVDRPCMVARMRVNEHGEKISHRFMRGVMRSKASLEYNQVQRAIDGQPDEVTAPLLDTVLKPLYACYGAMKQARANRQPLDLDLPERQIILSEEGKVLSVAFKDRVDAHKLIEECMVMANVAAAEELQRLKQPLLYRVHEEPAPDRLDALREVAQNSGFTLAKGQVLQTAHLNSLLRQARDSEFDELINISTLRSMTQAYYAPDNFGHFGLALKNYAHFTSPIRRYADLIVHRGLIRGLGLGDDGLSDFDIDEIGETGKLISDTERRSMAAERDTTDRYLAAWLSDRVGATFTGRVSGVQKFGLFVKLDETGADGLVPIREVGREFFHFDPEAQVIIGSQSGMTIGIGARVTVRLAEAIATTGGITLELLEVESQNLPSGKRKLGGFGKKGKSGPGRAFGKAKAAKEAKRRVVRRTRNS